jgi:hypothetical protein
LSPAFGLNAPPWPAAACGPRQVEMKSSLWFDASMLALILIVAVVAKAIGG